MIPLTDRELQDFQTVLDWKTGMRLPDGRALGVPGKRGKISAGIDFRVQAVAERLRSAGKTVLEVGCCEGIHTVQLAQVCKRVVAAEVRPKNIVGTLVRLFVHGATNVQVLMRDVRELDGRWGRFDIVFHVGVLYHLPDPVEHLFRVRGLGGDLLLDTHYGNDDTPFGRTTVHHAGRAYAAFQVGEAGWEDQFAGVEPTSLWLHRQALLDVLRDAGYVGVEVVRDRVERNGPRITILARQPSGLGRLLRRARGACRRVLRPLRGARGMLARNGN